MDITQFLNPKTHQKISLLPPQALKYLLKQIEELPEDQPERQKMMRIADIASAALEQKGAEKAEIEQRKFSLRRYFYLPFNKVLFDGEMEKRQSGRISRDSMEKIWSYIETKLMPNEVQELQAAFKTAILAKEMKKAKIIVNEFNRMAGRKLEEIVVKCRQNDREWARFAMVIGNKLVARDAEDLAYYLQNINQIEAALKLFSSEIPDLSGNLLTKTTNEMMKIKESSPQLFPLYISLLIGALKHPAHVLRIIQKYYRIDDASAAAKCDLAIIGDILLFNARVGAHNFTSDKVNDCERESHLENYMAFADAVLGIEREFDVSPISSWGKEIIELRSDVSDALEREILSGPQKLKNTLGRYQKIVDGIPTDEPNATDIKDLGRNIYLLHGVKNYIAATACNTIFRENYAKCMQFVEVYSVGIVEQLRRVDSSGQKQLVAYLEISADLIKILKGTEQADVYLKGGLLAMRNIEEEPV